MALLKVILWTVLLRIVVLLWHIPLPWECFLPVLLFLQVLLLLKFPLGLRFLGLRFRLLVLRFLLFRLLPSLKQLLLPPLPWKFPPLLFPEWFFPLQNQSVFLFQDFHQHVAVPAFVFPLPVFLQLPLFFFGLLNETAADFYSFLLYLSLSTTPATTTFFFYLNSTLVHYNTNFPLLVKLTKPK